MKEKWKSLPGSVKLSIIILMAMYITLGLFYPLGMGIVTVLIVTVLILTVLIVIMLCLIGILIYFLDNELNK